MKHTHVKFSSFKQLRSLRELRQPGSSFHLVLSIVYTRQNWFFRYKKLSSNAANEYQIIRSELATAENQLSDLRQRLDKEVSQHRATKDKLESTTNANVDLHKALNTSQSVQKNFTDEMTSMKASSEAAIAKAKELEKKLQEASETSASTERLSHTLNSHIESLQRSLKQEQAAHKTTRNFMTEQAEQIRSLQRTLAAVQQQRRQAQQAQLEAATRSRSMTASPVPAHRSHSPICSPRRQVGAGQLAVQSLVRQHEQATAGSHQEVAHASYESDVSYISEAQSDDDLLGGSGSVSGSALAAIRNSKRPASAASGMSGQPADAMARFAKYGRRIRTKSARPRLGAHGGSLAEAAVEPAVRAASKAYR